MSLLWFSPRVYVKANRPGIRHGVSHIEGAAEELMAWDTKGPKWTKAVQSCVDAFKGRVPPQEVREVFEAAAKEASVYLSPG
ncbi:DUF982 domain-containing protein [Mesorhizobium temperatum]|uniref:DUF982 domain-containing protein n=1 Tax=Mesorhizobium temperatum TaxID=241416 RepID=A0A271LN57_9HYPH|nr:DUF982 domain-containing protein [Mesorhizobium temperatum]PAQ09529.1 hypothetical protein CIT26_13465 [Mesorhizobium temperatum]